MGARWAVILGLVVASLAAPFSAVSAEEGASLEWQGDTVLRLDAYGGRTSFAGKPSTNPYSGCRFFSGAADDIRPWIRNLYVTLDGLDPDLYSDDLAWWDDLAARGTGFTFGSDPGEIVAGFCPKSVGKKFGGSPYAWWTAPGSDGDPDFEPWWESAFDEIPFPELTIVSAPNANTPFLTQLPVGMKPSVAIETLTGNAEVPVGVQTITVTAVPRSITFSVDGGLSTTCESPFPSDEELITELNPGCSLLFEEPTPPGATTALTLEVEYDIVTVCEPICFVAIRDAVITAEIPISIAEVAGLR